MDRDRPIDESLLLAQRGWVRRLAVELVGDAHAAEDVAQEALRLALERPPRARRLAALRRWLRVVVENVVRRDRNALAARRWHERRAAGGERVDPPDLDERLELQARLTEALRGLEEPYREAVVLRYVDDLSVREIARRQGIGEANARQLRPRTGESAEDVLLKTGVVGGAGDLVLRLP